jgi:segregation and condensation protein A
MPDDKPNPETPPPAQRAMDESALSTAGSDQPSAGADMEEAFALSAKRVSHLATPPPPVKAGAYEGPLDLLLDLIRKQQINIYDIPIAKITQQYLDYLHLMEELNIDVAGEFIFMAATLIHIKSRTLLPPDPTAPPEE